VVVDNASTDSTLQIVRREYPLVTIVAQDVNLGFAGGCNSGIRVALDHGARYIFLLNPDASVARNAIGLMEAALDDDQSIGIVSPIVRDRETRAIRYAGAKFDVRTLEFDIIGFGEEDETQYISRKRTGRPSGAAMMVRASAIDAVGMMDPSYFLYWEECEWTARFLKCGLGIGFEGKAEVDHQTSYSTGGPASTIYEYYYSRNMMRLFSDYSGEGRGKTSIATLPLLMRRVHDALRIYGARRAVTTAWSIGLGFSDFWKRKTGMRPSLHGRSNVPVGSHRASTRPEGAGSQ
jgi:hypothetical protein